MSCMVRLPSLKLSRTRKDSSAVATSIFSAGGKVSGDLRFEEEIQASVLRKFFLTAEANGRRATTAGSNWTLLVRMLTEGRCASTSSLQIEDATVFQRDSGDDRSRRDEAWSDVGIVRS